MNSGFSSVFKNRGFRYLWLNQILMQMSINALNFALIIWVYKLTNSIFAQSALILSIYLPALIFGIFAGVFADIVDKKKIIITVDILLAFLIFLFIFTKDYYLLIPINMFLINCLTQFFIPAESSSIPLVVNKKMLFLANSLFSLTLYGSFMIGYTLAGPVFDILGINTIFYLSGGALVLAFLMSQGLPPLKSGSHKKISQGIFKLTLAETKRTVNFVRGKLNVATAMGLLSGVQMGIGILAVMVSSYMERILKIQATDASFVLMLPLGLGMVSGALIAGRFFASIPRRFIVRPAILLAGVILFVVGLVPVMAPHIKALELYSYIDRLRYFFHVPILSTTFAVGAFLLGICAASIIIPSQTILQENTPAPIRGKIFAVLSVMMNAFAALPILLAGGLADLFGETAVFMGMGVIVFLIGCIALKPAMFFAEHALPYNIRAFLGLGHWGK
jgi:MFS family permease